jgi:carboxyl-terminal processing protease
MLNRNHNYKTTIRGRHNLCLAHLLKLVLPLLLILPLSVSSQEAEKPADVPDTAYQPLVYSNDDTETCLEVNRAVFARHYANQDMSYESLASDALKSYLEALDYRRMIFLSSDIAAFEQNYASRMNDILRDCNLEPAYNIFNTYRKKSMDRYEKLLTGLEERINNIDYSRNEYWHSNRKESDLPYPANPKEADHLWHADIKNTALAMRLQGKSSTDTVTAIRKQISTQRRNMRKVYSSDVLSAYLNAYLQLFDMHTSYFPPARSEDFNISMRLSLDGIGALLRQEGDYTKVAEVMSGGPADRQGELKAGDRITGVAQGLGDYENIIGWRLDKVVEKIRGPRNSTVRLKVIDAGTTGQEQFREISIVRGKVKLEKQAAKKEIIDVEYRGVVRRVGVVVLPSFYLDFDAQRQRERDYRSSSRDVDRLLSELVKAEPPVDGLIIDLRSNSGGSLAEANNVTGMFIEQGPSVQVRHSNGRLQRWGKPRRGKYYDKPLAVLMNRASASASEIFAAAMQDYGRAVIIGSRSYGKGTVQSLHPLSEGQIKVTDAKFYRISGASTQRRGVIPDVLYPAIYDVTTVGESVSEHALEWDQIHKVRHRDFYDIASIRGELQQLHESRTTDHPEFNYLREREKFRVDRRQRNKVLSLNETQRKMNHEQDKMQEETLKKIRDSATKDSAQSTTQVITANANTSTALAALHSTTTLNAGPGLKQLAKKEDKDKTAKKDKKGSKASKTKEDPLLVEAALILMDSIQILDPKRLISTNMSKPHSLHTPQQEAATAAP